MHIERLRLLGFKSFVEATDLVIEPGLTGVVGPNGCGKSNLLEALRWVMGETSYKSMRAAAMDDVIFSGTTQRPARNAAEVTIFIDNQARRAPAEFNDSDRIEITRRIEREAGSAYRINGREARARDIKILFEDAATGARSPALVRQGQIGEIVNAKPEQRRRILEDAAGIAGLHSRRHEAELRLKAAENNLARIGDILGQLKSQLDGLRRQARQARRYSELTGQIRQAEAVVLYLTWCAAQADVASEEAALREALEHLGVATQAEAAAIRREAGLGEAIQPLREDEMVRAAVVARLGHQRGTLVAEADQIRLREADLVEQARRLDVDLVREQELIDEAARQDTQQRERLAALDDSQDDGEVEAAMAAAVASAETELAAREAEWSAVQTRLGTLRAERSSLEAQRRERQARADRLAERLHQLETQLEKNRGDLPDAGRRAQLAADCEALSAAVASHEAAIAGAETAVHDAAAAQRETDQARQSAELALRGLETEQSTLARLIQAAAPEHPPVVDQMSVDPGYELALTAALGDDIEASDDASAPLHWGGSAILADDPPLPPGAVAMSGHVRAPEVLARRLAQIGIVEAADGARLAAGLAPGQRLVSKEGHLWRWDGYVASPDAPSPAAQQLAARNRLAELERQITEARDAYAHAAAAADNSVRRLEQARAAEHDARSAMRRDQAALNVARDGWAAIERAARDVAGRIEALTTQLEAATADAGEAAAALAEALTAIDGLADTAELDSELRDRDVSLRAAREMAAACRADLANLQRERARIAAERTRLAEEIAGWQRRAETSKARLAEMSGRHAEIARQRAALADRPAAIADAQARLEDEIEAAENARKAAADKLAETENALREAAGEVRRLAGDVAERREARARAEARLEGARQKRAAIGQHIQEALDTTPEGCLAVAGHADASRLPDLSAADAKLARLKTDRERLGGVNLQAERELAEIEAQHDGIDRERADIEQAIAKLRAGIASLNREGRKRLNAAFATVDGHFQALFATLFGGGEARLEMIQSEEDPLAGGLEIIAKPPGKKPTTLSLLSGGEQTLTALSLIFAVFLTNPSPICVLDEVDAPLDDANVDRFCLMMEKMAGDTDTRFLVITHHPMTMARMDRLFGVTMAERGVSQLVSVDLQAAEAFLEAGE